MIISKAGDTGEERESKTFQHRKDRKNIGEILAKTTRRS
jgi:hypothetical protein